MELIKVTLKNENKNPIYFEGDLDKLDINAKFLKVVNYYSGEIEYINTDIIDNVKSASYDIYWYTNLNQKGIVDITINEIKDKGFAILTPYVYSALLAYKLSSMGYKHEYGLDGDYTITVRSRKN